MPTFKSRRPMKKRPMGSGRPGGSGGPGGPGGKKKSFGGGGGSKKKRPPLKRTKKNIDKANQPSIENTGMESLYLKELVEDEKLMVVVLSTGEEVRGYIRYYDRDVFSIGPEDDSPKIFLRKASIRYMYEAE